MRILITTDLYKPAINGIVTSILNLQEELLNKGHDVRILTVSNRRDSYQNENVYYVKSAPVRICRDVRIPLSKASGYIKELIEWKPDVIHSQCEFFTFGYAKRIAKSTDAILIHTYHTLYGQYTEDAKSCKWLSKLVLGRWMRARLKGVDTIIAPTEKVRKVLNTYGVGQEIQVIPSGIRLERFQTQADAKTLAKLRETYGIRQDTYLMLSLGRLGYKKRIDELLYAMQRTVRAQSDVHLMIVGDGPARKQLEKLCKTLQIEQWVTFVGMVRPSMVRLYYQMSDCFVCASTSETRGLTYIEAAACGLPLLCKRDSCPEGVLEEGFSGYIYETIEEYVNHVNQMKTDIRWRNKAKEYSRNTAKRFGANIFANEVTESYLRAINKKEMDYIKSSNFIYQQVLS